MNIHTYFGSHGFPLVAVIDLATLPTHLTALMHAVPLAQYKRLVLTAHGGRSLWPKLQVNWPESKDPVDTYSRSVMRRYVEEHLIGEESLLLYPTQDYLIPLQQLGTYVGWSHPSPVGVGIHADYGLWFAYRTAFLTTAELTPTEIDLRPSPCLSCVDKPCLTACPAKALSANAPIQLDPCLNHRIAEESSCADRCLARMACPIGRDAYQYDLAQIQYHYTQGFEALKTWHLRKKAAQTQLDEDRGRPF